MMGPVFLQQAKKIWR